MNKPHKMQAFWGRVGEMLLKHDQDLCKDNGYLEIEADGVIYRSLPMDDHGCIFWVAWDPYHVIYHFSNLSDPGGTIKWVNYGDAAKPSGD